VTDLKVPTLRQELGIISTEELAAALDIPLSTVVTWRSRGGGPNFVRLGKHVQYRVEDVRAWILANLQRAA
jgi:predicted DNA-binding transcriptional regulator AlpA